MSELDKNKNLEVDNPTASDKGENDKDDKGTQGTEEPKTFNQEELDKIVSTRLAKEQSKLEKKLEEERKQIKSEAERLAQLSAEDKEKELREQQEKELNTKKRELVLRENRLDGREKLSELKMPAEFIDFVLDEDKDSQDEKIDKMHKAWTTAVADEVKKQTKGEAPKDPSSTEGDDKNADEAGSFFM